jgi:pyruvate dehydrogenase complex dehydrogenase (E1) component
MTTGDKMNMNDKLDAFETGEWLDALRAVGQHRGNQRSDHGVSQTPSGFGPHLDSH